MYGKFEDKLFKKIFKEEGSEVPETQEQFEEVEDLPKARPLAPGASTTWHNPNFEKKPEFSVASRQSLLCQRCGQGVNRLYIVDGKELCGICKRELNENH